MRLSLGRSREDELASSLAEVTHRLNKLQEYVDKTLGVVCNHFETYAHRSARPYFALDNGWGLTTLSTGQQFFVNTHDRNITPWIILGGHWEPNVDRVMTAYTQAGMHVLDIGAHMGYYTVKLGTQVGPTGRVMAFEPNPEVNSVCLENMKINGLTGRVSLHKHALGDFDGEAVLTRSESNMASANLIGEQDADFSVTVQVRRLDDVVPADVRPDLIKLDAEGFEKRILDGGARLLGRSPDCSIMIELGLERWERSAALSDLLPACGGGDKEAFAVNPDGSLKHIAVADLRPFLLTCDFSENYFLIGRPSVIRERVGQLVGD